MGLKNNTDGLPFRKMHGLGNDFVIVDARGQCDPVTPGIARAIGDRHLGVGFDQLAVILNGTDGADANIVFYNADGSNSAACGNATRCIARLICTENGQSPINLRTERGVLRAEMAENDQFRVNMGRPELNWKDIPLSRDVDLVNLPIEGSPGAVGMGNPHMVFAVPDVDSINLEARGSQLEHHPLYPAAANVEFCQVLSSSHIRMRVWERGTGVTLACGSGACAAVVALNRKGLTGRMVTVTLDGGDLYIDWRENGVCMTGPATHVFDGVFSSEILS